MVPEKKNRVVVTLQLNGTSYLFILQNAAIRAKETLFIQHNLLSLLKRQLFTKCEVQLLFFSIPSCSTLFQQFVFLLLRIDLLHTFFFGFIHNILTLFFMFISSLINRLLRSLVSFLQMNMLLCFLFCTNKL